MDWDWKEKRVLVTGGSGFIGQHVLAALVAHGGRPVSVQRHEPRELNSVALADEVEWVSADLSEPDTARSLLNKIEPDVVFHLAGLVHGARQRSAVLPMLDGNVRVAVDLMDAAVESGCERFIQAGSLEEPDDLDSPVASPYAASKLAASTYARLYREHYGLNTAVAKIFMVYGGGHQDKNKLVPYVIRQLIKGERPQLSGGTRPIDWIYVDDVVAGLLALAQSAEPAAELGSGRLATVRDVVAEIYAAMGKSELLETAPPFGAIEDRAAERVRQANTEVNEAIGWSAQTDLAAGVKNTVQWFRQRSGAVGSPD